MKIFKNKIIALLLLVALVMPILATPTQTYAASSSKSTKIESFAKKQLGKDTCGQLKDHLHLIVQDSHIML